MIEHVDERGRLVSQAEKWWEVHILAKRPWMDGWQDTVRLTLANPDSIYFDATFSNRECFYRTGVPINDDMLMKVVVEYDDHEKGSLVTAYPTRRISGKERQIWPWPEPIRKSHI